MKKVAVGIIMNDGKVLLCQRKNSARYGLKWEFPGGKVEEGEAIDRCLARELHEELGIDATVGTLYHRQHYVYPDSGTFDVFYYIVPSYTGNIVNHVFESFRWVHLSELSSYDILEGNNEVIGKLLNDHDALITQ